MKKMIDAEKFNLEDVLKRGLSVRDELVNEFNIARSKFAKVNWQNELEAFKNNPLDTAQSYLNQVNEALKSRTQEAAKDENASTVQAPETSRKPRAAAAKSPRAKKPVAKKPAAKKTASKKPVAKKTVANKTAAKKTAATTRTKVASKSKTVRTAAKTATAK